MRISDWSSDVCSSDLARQLLEGHAGTDGLGARAENLHVAVVEQHQPVLAVEQSDGRGEMLDGLRQQILRPEGNAPGAVLVGKVAPCAAVAEEAAALVGQRHAAARPVLAVAARDHVAIEEFTKRPES